jgi:hypothetical protein
MNRILIALLFTIGLLESKICFSQIELNYVTMSTVECNINRKSNSRVSSEWNDVFKLKGDRYLYVRKFHTSMLNKSSYKVNVFLFDSNSKLISSNLDVMDSLGEEDYKSIRIWQFGERVLIVTVATDSRAHTCKFWDITDASAPIKLKEVEVVKSSENEGTPSFSSSPSGNFLMMLSDYAHNLVVFDHDFEVAFSKKLIPTPSEGGNKNNRVNQLEIDDEGYVSLSIFFEEPAGFLGNSTSGSWYFLGIDILFDKVHAWNMAEVWDITQYRGADSEILILGAGKTLFAYKDKGIRTVVFDIKRGEYSNAATISETLFSNPSKTSYYYSLTSSGVLESGKIFLLMEATIQDNCGAYVILIDEQGNFESIKRLTNAVSNYYDYKSRFSSTKDNVIAFRYECSEKEMKRIGKGPMDAKSGIVFKSAKAYQLLVFYDVERDLVNYAVCPQNPVDGIKGKDLNFYNNGILAVFDIKENVVAIKICDLNK